MAGPRQLTEQGKERKQQLLDAAAALFAERGYANTRIADICTAAGVAKGLFYWYFETKEALFIELVRSMRTRLRRAQAAASDPEADALTRMRQGAVASAPSRLLASGGRCPRTINRYITGVTIRLSTVDDTSPPMITQASGL